jgi:hypothetical protein
MIDIEPDHVAIGVESDVEAFDKLPRLRTCLAYRLDISVGDATLS